jgi:hypothetical protein
MDPTHSTPGKNTRIQSCEHQAGSKGTFPVEYCAFPELLDAADKLRPALKPVI